MDDFLVWFRKNLVWILSLVVIFGVGRYYLSQQEMEGVVPMSSRLVGENVGIAQPMMTKDVGISPVEPSVPPVLRDERLVIKDTSLSLLVSKVEETIKKIEELAKEKGGYLVESNLNKPEESETGSAVIRVPADKRAETLTQIRGLGVRVISETVIGQDVTDQYVDTEARLETLMATKQKLESLLGQATNVTEILNVQRELDNLQYQIDYLKGQQKYLEASASLSKITVYLSTDELSLPYAPDEAWRPSVIFKQAVRSLVRFARDSVNLLIWVGVFTPIWLPALLIIWLVRKNKSK